MKGIDAIISSFVEAQKLKKLILLIYLCQFTLSMIVGIATSRYINKLSHTLSLRKLLYAYDYTILEDLKHTFSSHYDAIGSAVFFVVIVHVILSVFLQSGLLYAVYHRRYLLSDFIRGVKCYYRRFIGVALIFWCLAIIWTILVWMPYVTNVFYMIEHWAAEYLIIWILVALAITYFVGLSFLFAWSVQTRYFMIYQSYWSWNTFRAGFTQVSNRFADHSIILFLYAFLLALGYCIYMILELNIGISGVLMILFFIIIQQLWVLIKLWHRTSVYISLRNLQRIRKNG